MEPTRTEGTVELAPGLASPAKLELERRIGEPAVTVTLTAEWEAGTYRVRRVEAVGADVPREVLERLPVRALVAEAVLANMVRTWDGEPSPAQAAASVYRVGLVVGQAPTQLVADQLGISRATAARRVAEARAQGLLRDDEVAPQGGAATRRSPGLD